MNAASRLLPVALLLLVGGAAVAQDDPAAAPPPPPFAPAAEDTVPVLPGMVWVDLDSLLLAGQGVMVAFEDTFAFDPGTADTMLVTAPRVRIEEVIQAIGERMERDAAAMRTYEYTVLITMIQRYDPGFNGDDYTLFETAIRQRETNDGARQSVVLWERTREYEDGELKDEKVEDEMEADWGRIGQTVIDAIPFTPTSGHRYDYEILDRMLIGGSLVYKIRFEPKNRFEALPAGVVWVDYSNWVLRRVEAQFTQTVPFPLLVQSMPYFRLTNGPLGDYWVPREMHALLNLRHLPIGGVPDNIEMRTEFRDHVINGVAYDDDGTVRRTEPAAPPGEPVFDLRRGDEAAAPADTLDAWWHGLEQEWRRDVSRPVAGFSLAPARLDSLSRAGRDLLLKMDAGSLWRDRLDLLRAPAYNRVQGPVVRAAWTLEQVGPNRPRLDLAAGYAFASRRPELGAELALPLSRHRWRLRGGYGEGAEYTRLALTLGADKGLIRFAGDGREHSRTVSALLWGADPNHYLERRGVTAGLSWRAARRLSLGVSAALAEDRPQTRQATWNLAGEPLDGRPNLAADALDRRRLGAHLDLGWGPARLTAAGTLEELRRGAFVTDRAPGEESLNQATLEVALEIDRLDGLGNQWLLRARHRAGDRPRPLQDRFWLGDYTSLRGYPAAELSGDVAHQASLDLRLNWDLWRSLHVPGLGGLGLQPLLFADWARTRDLDEVTMPPDRPERALGAQDWRLDVGFGFGKRFDLPGLGSFNKWRLYCAKPVANDQDGRGWRVLLGVER